MEQWSRPRTLSDWGTLGATKSLSLSWASTAGRAVQRPVGAGTRTRPQTRMGRPAMVPGGRSAGAPDRRSSRAPLWQPAAGAPDCRISPSASSRLRTSKASGAPSLTPPPSLASATGGSRQGRRTRTGRPSMRAGAVVTTLPRQPPWCVPRPAQPRRVRLVRPAAPAPPPRHGRRCSRVPRPRPQRRGAWGRRWS